VCVCVCVCVCVTCSSGSVQRPSDVTVLSREKNDKALWRNDPWKQEGTIADILFTWCVNESSPSLLSCLMSWPMLANPQTLSNCDPHNVWWLVTNCSRLAKNVAHFPRPIIVCNTIQWVICEISKGQVLGFCVAEQAIVRIRSRV